MWNNDLQKSVMNFGSIIRFYWNHCIAITCVFKLGGVSMSILRRVKWNATTSILSIMASNYQSEFHFCLRDRMTAVCSSFTILVPKKFLCHFLPSPLHYCNPPILNFWKSFQLPRTPPPSTPDYSNPPIFRYSRVNIK